jgi:hypothetical protein
MSPTNISRERSEVLETVYLHSSENAGGPDMRSLKSFLSSYFPTIKMTIAPPPIRRVRATGRASFARLLAASRVKDPTKREQSYEPMYGEVEYELRVIEGESKAGGIVYDGGRLALALQGLIGQSDLRTAHIILTDRLVSTFSDEDLRHHLRTLIAGFPSIISIPGIVEAPAKPRAYHVQKQTLEMMGAPQLELERLKREFKGRFIDYGDPAISVVVEGLALQATMYHLTLDPFCTNKHCRLYNAHWQEDLIASQVGQRNGLCYKHKRLIQALGLDPSIRWLLNSHR